MENSAPDRQQVRVTILSRPYTLLTTGDSREVEEVAASVDELMLSIAAKAPNADSTRIAVLACLHLADRMRTLERDLSQLKQRVDRKSEEFAGMLEQLIEGTGEQLMIWRIALPALAGVALFAATAYQTEIAEWRRQREDEPEARWRLAHRRRPVLAARRRQHLRQGPGQRNRAARWRRQGRHLRTAQRQGHGEDGRRRPRIVARFPGRCQGRPPEPVRHQARGQVRHSAEGSGQPVPPRIPRHRELSGEGRVQGDRQMGGGAAEDSDSQHPGPDRVHGEPRLRRIPTATARSIALRPYLETADAKELFYIFRDQTSAKETYGAGRFLYSAMPEDGQVVLDFNKAYNPPCAFTPYATCPLPPAGESPGGAHRGRRKEVRALTSRRLQYRLRSLWRTITCRVEFLTRYIIDRAAVFAFERITFATGATVLAKVPLCPRSRRTCSLTASVESADCAATRRSRPSLDIPSAWIGDLRQHVSCAFG